MRVAGQRLRLFLALLLLFPVSVWASADGGDLRVVVSIKPVHAIVSALLQGITKPALLVGRGEIPQNHRLTSRDEDLLKRADVVIWAGPELEKFMAGAVAALPKRVRVVTLLDSDALKILPSRWNDRERDPYFWLDSRNALILVDELTRLFLEIDGERAHVYRRNRDRLMRRLGELDRRLEYGYRGLKGGIILGYFDTLQYFEQAYALKVGATLSPRPGVPVTAERLLKQRNKLLQGEYACVLTERGMAMPEYDLLMNGVKVNHAELDSFGTRFEPGEGLYLKLMEYDTRTIKKCVHPKGTVQEDRNEMLSFAGEGIGGRFVLIDHNGKLVTPESMRGKYALIYFGYTYCPDVCPTSLQIMSSALKKLPPAVRRKIQPYFITVDPERDTQKVLADYVAYFDKDLIGVTGSKAMIQRVLNEFGVIAERVPDKGGDPKKYLIDHTASFYLMAPDGRFITKIAHGLTADGVARKLESYVR